MTEKDPKLIGPGKKPTLPAQPPKRTSIITTILIFMVAFFVGTQMISMLNHTETDTLLTSEFVQAVEQDRVINVVYDAGNHTVSGKYYPAATAGASAANEYNEAMESLNAQMSLHTTDAGEALEGVTTTPLTEQSLTEERGYSATWYGGQDFLISMLSAHPDTSYEVRLPSGFMDILMSLLPILVIAGLMIFFFSQMSKANNSQMSFGKSRAK